MEAPPEAGFLDPWFRIGCVGRMTPATVWVLAVALKTGSGCAASGASWFNFTGYVMLVWSWATPILFHKYSMRVNKAASLHPNTSASLVNSTKLLPSTIEIHQKQTPPTCLSLLGTLAWNTTLYLSVGVGANRNQRHLQDPSCHHPPTSRCLPRARLRR